MQKYIKKQRLFLGWQTFWQKYHFLPFFLLFVFVFCFLFWLQYSNSFADPDSFYHAKIIWLMQKKIAAGQLPIFKEFPWLYYTVLKTNYIDHHFLYHLLSVPFLLFAQALFKLPLFSQSSIIDSYKILIGFKLATVGWATLFIITFYWLLKKLKIKGAMFFSLLLLITNPFVFRLSLGKATATSLIFLFCGIYFCHRHKGVQHPIGCWTPYALFILSFFYVWLYGGWPLMLVVVGAWITADAIANFFSQPKKKTQNFVSLLFGKSNLKLLLITIGGLAAGLIINPYFPKNLTFYYHQIYQIAIVNYQKILNVGGEWYPYNFFELISSSSLVFLLTIPAIVLFVYNLIFYYKNKNQGRGVLQYAPTLIFSFILAIIFLTLTLRSRRHVEYLFPFLVLFIASSFNATIKNFCRPKIGKQILDAINKKWLTASIVGGFIVVSLPYIIWRDVATTRQGLLSGFSWDTWQGASIWLKNNAEEQEIIFHNDWDDWPFLFFHNEQNYYVVGLDPTFMYNLNADLYQEWSDATLGRNTIPLNNLIPQKFNSKYILVDSEHLALERQIIADGNFERVFSDEETRVYRLTEFKSTNEIQIYKSIDK
jgi:hypothetical protein